jgi:hypothetical protein
MNQGKERVLLNLPVIHKGLMTERIMREATKPTA